MNLFSDNINVAVDKVVPSECVFLNWDKEMKRCILKIIKKT